MKNLKFLAALLALTIGLAGCGGSSKGGSASSSKPEKMLDGDNMTAPSTQEQEYEEPEDVTYCWVSVKQFSKNDTATACQDWLRSTRLGRGSIKSHVRTVKVLGMGLFAFQERIHLWKGVTH